jgi:hypothetical protein
MASTGALAVTFVAQPVMAAAAAEPVAVGIPEWVRYALLAMVCPSEWGRYARSVLGMKQPEDRGGSGGGD